MPTYEYVCTACQNQWEEIQKISESAIEVCPKCGKSTAKRQISGGNFILKGGGWYADLYSSSPKKDGKSEGASSDSKKSESATSTANAKPEASSTSPSPSTSSGPSSSPSSGSTSK